MKQGIVEQYNNEIKRNCLGKGFGACTWLFLAIFSMRLLSKVIVVMADCGFAWSETALCSVGEWCLNLSFTDFVLIDPF